MTPKVNHNDHKPNGSPHVKEAGLIAGISGIITALLFLIAHVAIDVGRLANSIVLGGLGLGLFFVLLGAGIYIIGTKCNTERDKDV
jgi:VIT1/CCC1 family predicted Fe2+/Mn2+ transporter